MPIARSLGGNEADRPMSTWKRVSSRSPCPVCGKPDWCGVTADASAACCMRIESAKRLRNGGWLHRQRKRAPWEREIPARFVVRVHPSRRDMRELAGRYEHAPLRADVERLAHKLGVSVDSLRRLHIGWDGEAWTFPMNDGSGNVIGIRRRLPNGRKLSVRGGREGLFVPEGLAGAGLLLVCEGPTDTAALLTLDFPAVGRPSCHGGVQLLCKFCRGRGVVVFADGDDPGRVGARILAQALRLYCPVVRVIRPPDDGLKDAREWLRQGATHADVERVIAASEPLQLTVTAKPAGRRLPARLRTLCHVG